MGEFICDCSNKFFEWSSKDISSECKKCNLLCQPIRIMSNLTRLGSNNSLSCSTNSSSDNSNFKQSKNYRCNFQPTNRKYYCNKCGDTNIDMEKSVIFKPQNGSYMSYVTTKKHKSNTGLFSNN